MSNSTSSLPPMLTDVSKIWEQENAIVFETFTSETAFELGCLLRKRIPELVPSGPPAAVHIATATNNVLFHAVTKPGNGSGSSIALDNDIWVTRKKDTVLRWGTSTYALHHKFNGLATQEDITAFSIRFGQENIAKYCLFGGGFPVRVKGIEGVVAVIVVSGLKHHEDHLVILKVLEEFLSSQKKA